MAVPAAAAPTDLSVLYDDATEWADPDPGYLNIMAEVGGANADNRDATVLKLINLPARSPVVLAFTLASDPDHIWVGHSLTHYPTDILAATPFDNGAMVLVGQDAHRTVPISLARDASGRTSQTRALRSDEITGNTLLTAAPPVLRSGPHGNGTPDSDLLVVRRVCLLPSDIAGTAIAASPSGRFSYIGFYNTFLRAEMTSGDVNRQAKYTPLDEWFRLVCTSGRNAAPAGPPLSVLAVGIPHHLITARSLRSGGATALLCADVDPDAIKLLGRWQSDAMLRYLRVQASATRERYAQRMLDHGSYTFSTLSSASSAAAPLPDQVPPAFARAATVATTH